MFRDTAVSLSNAHFSQCKLRSIFSTEPKGRHGLQLGRAAHFPVDESMALHKPNF